LADTIIHHEGDAILPDDLCAPEVEDLAGSHFRGVRRLAILVVPRNDRFEGIGRESRE
jgi:hypothetical protein